LKTLPVDATEPIETSFSKSSSLPFVALAEKRKQQQQQVSTSQGLSRSLLAPPHHFIDLENQFEVQDAESRVEGEEDPDERGRRFTLTDSNYESTKENEKSGSNLLPSQGMGSGSSAGLSTAAQHYLKSLPDFSFMLVAPSVENGKE
jgi:hypothetical protein